MRLNKLNIISEELLFLSGFSHVSNVVTNLFLHVNVNIKFNFTRKKYLFFNFLILNFLKNYLFA